MRRRLTGAPPAPASPPPPAARPVRRARRHQYVVVVTYGRSGSTLVQGILNALPRTVVRGETSFFLMHLFRAHDQLRHFRGLHLAHGTQASTSAFFGLHEARPRAFRRSAQNLLLDVLLGSTDPGEVDVLGFKEVAWHRLRIPEHEAFFDYLEALLPDVRYVLHERTLTEVVGSGFWKGRELEGSLGKIHRVERVQQLLRDTRPDRVLDTHFSRLTSDDPGVRDAELRALAQFAHASCDDDLMDRLRATLTVGHGPYPFGASRAGSDEGSDERSDEGSDEEPDD